MKKIVEYQDEKELIGKLRLIIKEATKKAGGPVDAYNAIKKWASLEQEHFLVVILDGAHQIIDAISVTSGLVNRTIIHPREVFRPALMLNACAVIIAHNHPSGNLEPSPEDLDITERIKEAGEILGIGVLDHLIISPNGFQSLVESGQF